MRRYFRLQTLGRLTLTVVDGETESLAGIRPRHLAVLTVIALSARPISRDALVEMFWGGEDETRARHSLSNALSGLRGALGADALTSRRDHIALAEDARVEVDTAQFTAAFEAGDDARAIAVYGGRFLDAVHVPDAPAFDDWASRERAKLERRFVEACERYVARLERAAQPGSPLSPSAGRRRQFAVRRGCDRDVNTQRLAAKEPAIAPASPTPQSPRSPRRVDAAVTPLAARRVTCRAVGDRGLGRPRDLDCRRFVLAVPTHIKRGFAATHPIVVTSIEDARGDVGQWPRVAHRMIAADSTDCAASNRSRRLGTGCVARLADRAPRDSASNNRGTSRAGCAPAGRSPAAVAPNGYVLDLTVRNAADVSPEAFDTRRIL
jgi:hypothetical protein